MMTQPAAKAPKKATGTKKPGPKKSPRAAPAGTQPPAPEALPELMDEDLAALAEGPPAEDDGEIRPVLIGKRGRRGDTKVEMVTVFEIDDVAYKIPKEPSPALVLRFLTDLVTHGRLLAVHRMSMTLLGDAAMEALAASPEVEVADVSDVFTNVGRIFFGSATYKDMLAASDPS